MTEHWNATLIRVDENARITGVCKGYVFVWDKAPSRAQRSVIIAASGLTCAWQGTPRFHRWLLSQVWPDGIVIRAGLADYERISAWLKTKASRFPARTGVLQERIR